MDRHDDSECHDPNEPTGPEPRPEAQPWWKEPNVRVATSILVAVVIAVGLAGCSTSALGSSAKTEEGFFFSGTTRLSYALDIPVVGSPPYPMVVFGHDSGRNTKNEEKAWARHLVENGFAVFRFDKRGIGDSDGVYRRGFVEEHLVAGDLVAAVDFVIQDSRVDRTRIGLMGRSQAGWIIPISATQSEHVAFTIFVSGPAVTNGQHNFWVDISGDKNLTISQLSAMLTDFELPDGTLDPRPFIEEMAAPGLWLFGDQDRTIPARESAQIVRDVAEEFGRPFTAVIYPNANHSLRDVDSGDPIDIWVDLLPWLDSVTR